MKITTRIVGDKRFQRKVRFLESALDKPRGLYKGWGLTALRWIHQNYKSGGGKLKTGKWKRLRPLTIASRRKSSRRPLQDTGHLERQWNSGLIGNGVKVGNPLNIAFFHNYGTDPYEIRPKNRKVLWFGVQPAQRTRGQKVGGHLATVTDKVSPYGKKGAPGIFANFVRHPGLPARRQLPTNAELFPDIEKVTNAFIKKVIK